MKGGNLPCDRTGEFEVHFGKADVRQGLISFHPIPDPDEPLDKRSGPIGTPWQDEYVPHVQDAQASSREGGGCIGGGATGSSLTQTSSPSTFTG